MKTKFKITKEIKVKTIIISILVMLLVLSFFFAEQIEYGLGLKTSFAKNETSIINSKKSPYSVTYIDVGQGHSTFIKFPDGKTMLIDSGDISSVSKVENVIRDAGVDCVDYLVATHADADHIGGFAYLLGVFEFKNIYRPCQIAGSGSTFETFNVYEDEDLKDAYEYYVNIYGKESLISRVTTSIYKDFISSIYNETHTIDGAQQNSQVTVFYDGLKVQGKDYKFEFFAPAKRDDSPELTYFGGETKGYVTRGYGAGNSNGCSAIVLVSISDEKFLFTGDAPWSAGKLNGSNFAELNFVASLSLQERAEFQNISVYLAGHHGAKTSSGEVLLELINPQFVVISVGENNNGHPSKEVIERFEKTDNIEKDYLLRTDEKGTITFFSYQGDLHYALEITTQKQEVQISWFLLGSVMFVFVASIVIFVKFQTIKK